MASSDGMGKALALLVILFFTGIFAIYDGMKKYLRVQKIKNTPTSKAASAAVGLVELAGTARCNGNMVSPISGVKCAYWKITGEYYRSGKHGGWKEIYFGDSSGLNNSEAQGPEATGFYTEDETGRMLVNPQKGEVDIPFDKEFRGHIEGKGLFGEINPKMGESVLKFIESLPSEGKSKFMARKDEDLRVREYYVADGDEVYVLGSAQPREGAASSTGSENLVVQWHISDNLLYISDSGERKVLEKLSGNMYLKIFGGLALSAVCLFLILSMIWPSIS